MVWVVPYFSFQFEIFDVLGQKLGEILDEIRSRLPLQLNSQFRLTQADLESKGDMFKIIDLMIIIYVMT